VLGSQGVDDGTSDTKGVVLATDVLVSAGSGDSVGVGGRDVAATGVVVHADSGPSVVVGGKGVIGPTPWFELGVAVIPDVAEAARVAVVRAVAKGDAAQVDVTVGVAVGVAGLATLASSAVPNGVGVIDLVGTIAILAVGDAVRVGPASPCRCLVGHVNQMPPTRARISTAAAIWPSSDRHCPRRT